ncbi:MAG TPA: type II secretion system protein [Phycisphaerales bacterium]|nr:type II secretion system protein [Phycisphaerales bacterium]
MLVFVAAVTIGGAVMIVRASHRFRLARRLAESEETGRLETTEGHSGRAVDALGRIGKAMTSGKTSISLQQQLAEAGFHNPSTPGVYIGGKFLLLLIGLILFSALIFPLPLPLPTRVFLVLLGSCLLFFIPNFIVSRRRAERKQEVREALPDAIDLLEVCVSAGMGLDMAWSLVIEQMRPVSPTLADEMALVDLEIHLGASRVAAMRNMSRRTGADEIRSLVGVLAQTDRFGTSIADALRVFASTMRERRSTDAQELAEKTSVKLLFPMLLFIFPAMLLIAVGPAAIRLMAMIASR